MKCQTGFTLIEMMFALAIVAILATIAANSYSNVMAQSNFRSMRDVGAKIALAQQQHRQFFGQYATRVVDNGQTNTSTLVLPEASQYNITISNAGFRDFVATLTPRSSNLQGTSDCWSVRVSSLRGFLSYSALNNAQQDSTARCMPNG